MAVNLCSGSLRDKKTQFKMHAMLGYIVLYEHYFSL